MQVRFPNINYNYGKTINQPSVRGDRLLRPLQQDVVSFSGSEKIPDQMPTDLKIKKIQTEIGDKIKENDVKAILNYFDIECEEDKNGLLTIDCYRQPSNKFRFNDLGIDEDKLFEKIKAIKGKADFENSNITNLGELQSIGGNAIFRKSKIKDLGKLQSIGGDADFCKAYITDLGNLQSIGGNADFCKAYITSASLGKLQSIGGNADFGLSNITDLGELQSIGGNAYFENSMITNLGNLQTIGRNVVFRNSKITDLGNLQSIGGDAFFEGANITNLGNLQSIGGDAYCNSDLNQMTTDLKINKIQTEIGDKIKKNDVKAILNYFNIECEEDENGLLTIDCYRQPSKEFSFNDLGIDEDKLFKKIKAIKGKANFENSNITSLGNLQSIGSDVYCNPTTLIDFKELKHIGGKFYYKNPRQWLQ